MKTTGVFLILVFMTGYAYADLIVYPKDVKGWEQQDKQPLDKIQKAQDADTEDMGWRTSPEDVGTLFFTTYYGLDKTKSSEWWSDGKFLVNEDTRAVWQFKFRGKIHIIELETPTKPISQGGFFTVKRMIIK